MPKRNNLVLMKYNHQKHMPCEYCNFFSTSITAMRLHRKSRHGVRTKFDEDAIEYDFHCTGCKKKTKNCKCSKK